MTLVPPEVIFTCRQDNIKEHYLIIPLRLNAMIVLLIIMEIKEIAYYN